MALHELKSRIDSIEENLHGTAVTPPNHQIMRALTAPISQTRVVIFGQDPYPTQGYAHGLAFSVDSSVTALPASLRNIFEELRSDTDIVKVNGDLGQWSDQGVMMINRILTTEIGKSMAHKDIGWQEVTTRVAQILGKRDVVGIFWGRSAQELEGFFRPEWSISSVHPSPLSAYKGFYGSKPFSKCNEILKRNNFPEISW